MSELHSVRRGNVTAIVISQGRDVQYLRQTLEALDAQILPPNRTIVAVESMEAHAAQAVAGFDDVDLETIGEQESLADAIEVARAGVEADESEWLWLIHADSAPYPEALDRLLRSAESSRNAGAVGPKQVTWDSDDVRTLLEVGIRATRSGRRVPEVEPGERDQGQLDSRTDVLGVGTAGMLVNRDAFDQVGGLNSDFGPFGDGLELSRRLRWAGYRVFVEPTAVVRHARTSLGEDLSMSFASRRTAQVRNGLIAAPTILIPLLWLIYTLVSVPRALARLAFKEGRYARSELRAGLAIAGILPSVLRGRRAVSSASTVSRDALSALEATPAEVRQARNDIKKSRAEAKQMETIPDPLTIRAREDLRKHTIRGFVITAVVATALSIALLVPYASSGQLVGGSLGPSVATAGDVWRGALSGWLATGDGYHMAIDPLWVALLPFLVLGLPFGLTVGGLATGIMWLALPLGAIAAYAALRRFTLSWVVRCTLALAWISAPHWIEAILEGRLSVVIAHILLPVFVFTLVGMWRGSVMMAGLAALVLAGLVSTTPAYAVVGIAIALVGVLTRRGARGRWILFVIPALAMLAPTLRHLTRDDLPAYLFTTAGVPFAATTDPREILTFTTMTQLTGHPSWSWLIYGALFVLVSAAIFVLLRRHQRGTIRLGWWTMAAGLAWALTATRFVTAETAGLDAQSIFGIPHFGQSLAWTGLMITLACGGNALRTSLRERAFGLAQLATAGLIILMPLTIPAIWGYVLHEHYATDRDHVALGERVLLLPAVAGEDQEIDLRVLNLTATPDGIEAQLWRSRGIDMAEQSSVEALRLATSTASATDDASTDLAQAVADVTSSSDLAAQKLGDHGISVVLVPPDNAGVVDIERNELINALQAIDGLTYISSNEAGEFWRIESRDGYPARARLSDGTALTSSEIDAHAQITGSSEDRLLYLAERADGHWQTELDGHTLERADADWRQAWTVPAGAHGELNVTFSDPIHTALAWLQVITLIMALVAALPLRRRKAVGE